MLLWCEVSVSCTFACLRPVHLLRSDKSAIQVSFWKGCLLTRARAAKPEDLKSRSRMKFEVKWVSNPSEHRSSHAFAKWTMMTVVASHCTRPILRMQAQRNAYLNVRNTKEEGLKMQRSQTFAAFRSDPDIWEMIVGVSRKNAFPYVLFWPRSSSGGKKTAQGQLVTFESDLLIQLVVNL